jgi:hypothetical protein
VPGDPVGQPGIAQPGERGERPLAHLAVAADVVAGQDAEGGDAPVTAASECLGHQAEHGARHGSRPQVGQHRRIGRVELAGDRVEVVAALGDGERHDPGGRRGHLLDHGLRIIGREQVLHDRPDYPGLPGAVPVPQDQGVQAVLSGQRVAHPGVRRLHPDAADAPVHRRAAIHQRVDVHGLVRAVETADADVHDPGRDLAAVVTGNGHGGVQPRQGLPGQDGHAVPSSECPPADRRTETARRNLA